MYNGSLVADDWSENSLTLINGQNWASTCSGSYGITLTSENVPHVMRSAINKLKINNENNMQIGKKELFKIVLRETVVKDFTHEVMAKDKEDALEIIKNGCSAYSHQTVSVEVVEVV